MKKKITCDDCGFEECDDCLFHAIDAEKEENHKNELRFLSSFRGRYIVGQALYYAIQVMESVEPEVHQEKSDISDMKYLRDELFNFPEEMFTSQKPTEGIRTDIDLTFEENGIIPCV